MKLLKTVITAQTAGANADMVVSSTPAIAVADGLAGAETVDIDVYGPDGTAVTYLQLTASAPAKVIEAPAKYKFTKSVTVGTASVGVSSSAVQAL